MSRYTCHNCKFEHGTDNMVAYCAACYSDGRSEFASLREVNIQIAQDSVNLRSQLAAEKAQRTELERAVMVETDRVKAAWIAEDQAKKRAEAAESKLTEALSEKAEEMKRADGWIKHSERLALLRDEAQRQAMTAEAALAKEKGYAKACEESAAMMSRNAGFYRGIVVKVGEMFGVEAKTSDDGSVQQDVLALKVPELVKELMTRVEYEAMESYRENMARKAAEFQVAALTEKVAALEKDKKESDFWLEEFRKVAGERGDDLVKTRDILRGIRDENAALTEKVFAVNAINKALDKDLGDRTHELALMMDKVAGLTAVVEQARAYRDKLLAVGYKSFKTDAERASFYNDGLKTLSAILNTPIEPILAAKEAEVKALTEKVAGLAAALKHHIECPTCDIMSCACKTIAEMVLKDTAPILAAHDAAKQAELVGEVRFAASMANMLPNDYICGAWTKSDYEERFRAILAKYPKAAKEDD